MQEANTTVSHRVPHGSKDRDVSKGDGYHHALQPLTGLPAHRDNGTGGVLGTSGDHSAGLPPGTGPLLVAYQWLHFLVCFSKITSGRVSQMLLLSEATGPDLLTTTVSASGQQCQADARECFNITIIIGFNHRRRPRSATSRNTQDSKPANRVFHLASGEWQLFTPRPL